MLSINNLTVKYGQITAVREISFEVKKGEIACIVGPNGAGKSTTLLTISGVLKPSNGDINLDNNTIAGFSPEQIAGLGVTQVPEGRHIFTSLTVEENLKVGAALRNDKETIAQDIERITTLFPILGERKQQQAGKLSGGEQQMLAIGRALMTNPSIMTIDEPSLGLAPIIIDKVYEALVSLRQETGLTLLIVEQSAERALQVADMIYVLRNGEIKLKGTSKELKGNDKISKAYFGFDER